MLILDTKQTKKLEEEYISGGVENIKLMTTAGGSVAKFVREKYNSDGHAVAVLCGKGNNGGDGFAAAKKLAECGSKVRIILVSGQPATDDAIDLFGRADRAGIKSLSYILDEEKDEAVKTIAAADFIIDAMVGSGFEGELHPDIAEIVKLANMSTATKIAIDVPTGVNADTGEVPDIAFCADATVTFTTKKPCHTIYPGAGYCGSVVTVNIGISENGISSDEAALESLDYQYVRLCFPTRKANTNKGDYGKLLLVAGNEVMPGAAILASRSACQSGVGLVRLATAQQNIVAVASQNPDCTYVALSGASELAKESRRTLKEAVKNATAVAVGCGLGRNSVTDEIVKLVLEYSQVPMIFDADAIDSLSRLTGELKNAKAPIIITPHPGEMARLTGTTPDDIQQHRLNIAKNYAAEHGIYVVLKGANTIVACPNGKTYVNLTGNPGMSKGGMGDVLTGLMGSLLAQSMTPEDAAACAVYLHSFCGDRAAKRYSEHAMTPSDIIYEFQPIFLEIER